MRASGIRSLALVVTFLAALGVAGTGAAAPAHPGLSGPSSVSGTMTEVKPSSSSSSLQDGRIVLAQNDRGWHPLSPLLRLFRGGRSSRPTRKLREPKRPKRSIIRAAPTPPKVVEEPKTENARTVLVVGDKMAEGLARGLKASYAKTSTIKVESEISRSRGLLREADPDWPTRIKARLDKGEADVVVVMLGTDDRRGLVMDGQRTNFRDPAWQEVYRAVVQRTVASVRDGRRPLVWVGLPPVSGPDRRSDFSYLNDFYKEKVETADGIFVDIWEAFLSEEGKYTSYGADVDGQRQRLRTSDGLYFTWPGYRKVAFFVQQRLARILGEGPALELAFPGGDSNVVLLTGGASREETLAGEEIAPAIPTEGSLQHRLIVEGRALPRVEGRVDDFRRAD